MHAHRQPENMPLAGPIHWMGGDIKTKLQMTRVPETKDMKHHNWQRQVMYPTHTQIK